MQQDGKDKMDNASKKKSKQPYLSHSDWSPIATSFGTTIYPNFSLKNIIFGTINKEFKTQLKLT